MPLSENLVFIADSRMKNPVSNSLSSGLRSILEKLWNRCLFVLNIPDSIRCLSLCFLNVNTLPTQWFLRWISNDRWVLPEGKTTR